MSTTVAQPPANNPSWEEVSSFLNSSRDQLSSLGKQKYEQLLLHDYLAWALSVIQEQEQQQQYRRKAHELTSTYALLAKYRLEILHLVKTLAIKSDPYKELVAKKVTQKDKKLVQKYQSYRHDLYDEILLINFAKAFAVMAAPHELIMSSIFEMIIPVIIRSSHALSATIQKLVKPKSNEPAQELSASVVIGAIQSVFDWEKHFNELIQKLLMPDAQESTEAGKAKNLVKSRSQFLLTASAMNDCLSQFVMSQIKDSKERSPESKKDFASVLGIIADMAVFFNSIVNTIIRCFIEVPNDNKSNLISIIDQILELKSKYRFHQTFTSLSRILHDYTTSRKRNQSLVESSSSSSSSLVDANPVATSSDSSTSIPPSAIDVNMFHLVDVEPVLAINAPPKKTSTSAHGYSRIPIKCRALNAAVKNYETSVFPCDTKHAKVQWRTDLGTALLKFTPQEGSSSYLIQVSTYQMIILQLLEECGQTLEELCTNMFQFPANSGVNDSLVQQLKSEAREIIREEIMELVQGRPDTHGPCSNLVEFQNTEKLSITIKDDTLFIINDYFEISPPQQQQQQQQQEQKSEQTVPDICFDTAYSFERATRQLKALKPVFASNVPPLVQPTPPPLVQPPQPTLKPLLQPSVAAPASTIPPAPLGVTPSIPAPTVPSQPQQQIVTPATPLVSPPLLPPLLPLLANHGIRKPFVNTVHAMTQVIMDHLKANTRLEYIESEKPTYQFLLTAVTTMSKLITQYQVPHVYHIIEAIDYLMSCNFIDQVSSISLQEELVIQKLRQEPLAHASLHVAKSAVAAPAAESSDEDEDAGFDLFGDDTPSKPKVKKAPVPAPSVSTSATNSKAQAVKSTFASKRAAVAKKPVAAPKILPAPPIVNAAPIPPAPPVNPFIGAPASSSASSSLFGPPVPPAPVPLLASSGLLPAAVPTSAPLSAALSPTSVSSAAQASLFDEPQEITPQQFVEMQKNKPLSTAKKIFQIATVEPKKDSKELEADMGSLF